MIKELKDLLKEPLFSNDFGEFSILLFFYSLLILVGAFLLSRLISRFLKRRIFRKYRLDIGTQSAYSRIIHYVIMFIAFLMALNTMGFRLSVLLASSAALMVGIGFGIQHIVNNFVSGLIILFERPVKVGDFIEVDGILGTVTDINTRSSKITTNDQITIVVPNSLLTENNMINWSYNKYTRINIPVSVAYNTDLDQARNIMLAVALRNPLVLRKPYPEVFCEEFGDNGVHLTLLVWIKQQHKYRIVKSQLNFSIFKAFRESGITIPFPQRDLHLRTASPAIKVENQPPGNEDERSS